MDLLPITDIALYWVKRDEPIPSAVHGYTVIGQSVSKKYVLLVVTGRWLLLVIVGYCWLLLVIVGYCWLLLIGVVVLVWCFPFLFFGN